MTEQVYSASKKGVSNNDTQNNKLVQSDTDASDFTLPTFFQGDVLVSSENSPMAGGCSRSHLAVSSLPVIGY